jgi:hypothetical protein
VKKQNVIQGLFRAIAERFQSAIAQLAAIMTTAGFPAFADGLHRQIAKAGDTSAERIEVNGVTLERGIRGYLPFERDEGEQLEALATWMQTIRVSVDGYTLQTVKARNGKEAKLIMQAYAATCRYTQSAMDLLGNLSKARQVVYSMTREDNDVLA